MSAESVWPRTPRDGDVPTRGSHEGWSLAAADHADERGSASRGRLDLVSSGRSWSEKPRNAEPPRRGGLSSGLAAALDEYEHAPHGGTRLLRGHAAAPAVSPAFRHPRRPARGARPCADSTGESPTRAAGHRQPRVRRLAAGRLRVLLPQRDRPAARDAGRHPGRHDGRVRHRLRCRHGLAALRRPRREGPDRDRRARPRLAQAACGDLRRRPARRGPGRGLVDAARQGSLLAAVPGLRPAQRGGRGRRRRPRRGRRHRRARRLHARARSGRPSPTAGSTRSASSG